MAWREKYSTLPRGYSLILQLQFLLVLRQSSVLRRNFYIFKKLIFSSKVTLKGVLQLELLMFVCGSSQARCSSSVWHSTDELLGKGTDSLY